MDMAYPFSIGIAAGLGALALLIKMRGARMLLMLLFVLGAALAMFAAHMACFYPLQAAGLSKTAWIYAPVIGGFILWFIFFCRLCVQHRSAL